MAKMLFYTLEEAAEKLGTSEEQVKEMVASGQLQQFRDRDKLMFKRDQVDALAGGDTARLEESGGPIDLSDSAAGTRSGTGTAGPISLVDTGESDAISLSDTAAGGTAMGTAGGTAEGTSGGTAAGQRTGMNVFETDEVEAADPMAQTQVTSGQGEDEEIALESVGSGSGLLDLTRESDDTSLGAELLDEIYPGGEASDSKMGSAVGSSGVFESALGTDTAAHSGAGAGLSGIGGGAPVATGPTTGVLPTQYDIDDVDPVWSGISAGLLLTAIIGLILGLIVMATALAGALGTVTSTLAQWNSLIVFGVLLVIAIILGGIGGAVGKAAR